MRLLVVLAAFGALAQARPEAGYSYTAPSNQYGAPGVGSSGFGGNGLGGGGFGGGFGGSSASFDVNCPNGQAGCASSSSFGGGSGGSGGFPGSTYGAPSTGGGTLIQKHIYVHVAPPEPEEARPQRPIAQQQAQKHYKIIFIKAPAPPTPTAPVIPAGALNEQKTLIYVLVKRPEDVGDINIPTAAPTAPSKPEVYFIRYKTNKEATAQVGTSGTASTTYGVPGRTGGPY